MDKTIRLFLVVRDTEEHGRQYAIFKILDEATECYEDTAYVVRNAPGEGTSNDLTIVTACALFAADTDNGELAKVMVEDGRAILLESEEWSH